MPSRTTKRVLLVIAALVAMYVIVAVIRTVVLLNHGAPLYVYDQEGRGGRLRRNGKGCMAVPVASNLDRYRIPSGKHKLQYVIDNREKGARTVVEELEVDIPEDVSPVDVFVYNVQGKGRLRLQEWRSEGAGPEHFTWEEAGAVTYTDRFFVIQQAGFVHPGDGLNKTLGSVGHRAYKLFAAGEEEVKTEMERKRWQAPPVEQAENGTAPFRTWTAMNGDTFEARFASLNPASLVVLLEDTEGEPRTASVAELSLTDRAYVVNWLWNFGEQTEARTWGVPYGPEGKPMEATVASVDPRTSVVLHLLLNGDARLLPLGRLKGPGDRAAVLAWLRNTEMLGPARTWADTHGRNVNAHLFMFDPANLSLLLLRPDGGEVNVRLPTLSTRDVSYVTTWLNEPPRRWGGEEMFKGRRKTVEGSLLVEHNGNVIVLLRDGERVGLRSPTLDEESKGYLKGWRQRHLLGLMESVNVHQPHWLAFNLGTRLVTNSLNSLWIARLLRARSLAPRTFGFGVVREGTPVWFVRPASGFRPKFQRETTGYQIKQLKGPEVGGERVELFLVVRN